MLTVAATTRALALFLLAVLVTGCQQVNKLQPVMAQYHARGDYAGAASFLDSDSTRKTYGEKSALLWELERGAVALALNDTTGAIDHLDRAEAGSAYKYDASDSDNFTKWVVNDAEASYVAQPYEDMYTNVLKQLAYLEAGKLQGFATAESLRVLNKSEHLRDVYRAYMQIGPSKKSAAAAPVSQHDQFIESPLGAYLAAVSFMKVSDRNNQDLSARRLNDALEREKAYVGPVNPADFDGLGNLATEDANLLIVGLSGRGPVKDEGRLSFPVVDSILNIPYPRLRQIPSQVSAISIEVDGAPTRDLSLVEDLSSVVAENYRRAEPAIRSRTVARVTAKIAAVVGGTVAVNQGARNSNGRGALTAATAVLGAILVQESEKADLRSWVFLPGQARVGLLKLPPGPHRVRLVYRLSGGGKIEQPWQDITLSERGLITLVSHYPG